MIDLSNINKIYLTPGSTDLRLGIDGYSKFNNLNVEKYLEYVFNELALLNNLVRMN